MSSRQDRIWVESTDIRIDRIDRASNFVAGCDLAHRQVIPFRIEMPVFLVARFGDTTRVGGESP